MTLANAILRWCILRAWLRADREELERMAGLRIEREDENDGS